jgi:hypothetical protein
MKTIADRSPAIGIRGQHAALPRPDSFHTEELLQRTPMVQDICSYNFLMFLRSLSKRMQATEDFLQD